MKKCYIYTRVSTAAQVEGYSLDAQIEALRNYAKYREYEIAGEYCDAGVSGGSVSGRLAFQSMITDIVEQKEDICCVLVFKLSRFGRNSADVLKYMQLLMDYGISLVSVHESIDSATQSGKLMLTILSAVAEIEKENITAQFMAGKLEKMRNGGWGGGPIPYGYRSVDKKLVIEPYEAKAVRMAYELYAEDKTSLISVAKALNASGYRKIVRGEERMFSSDSVKAILDNPIYSGRFIYNERSVTGQDIMKVDGQHEAIVSVEIWEKVHKKRAGCKKNEKVWDIERVSLLSGLVKCPCCGKGMVRIVSRSRNKNHGGMYKPVYGYVCRGHMVRGGDRCDFSRQYNQDKVDAAVYELIGRVGTLSSFEKRIEKAFDTKELSACEEKLKALRKQYYHKEAEKNTLGNTLDNLDVFRDDYLEQSEVIEQQIEKAYEEMSLLDEKIEAIKQQIELLERGVAVKDEIKELVSNFQIVFNKLTPGEKREMYSNLIDRIDVFPEKRDDGRIIKSITFKFPVSYDGIHGSKKGNTFLYTLDCSKIGITKSEAHATYAMIKSYVKEKHGVCVSQLNIAQIKRKYGLIERANYNKSKKKDARVPKCTLEKEKYITEALKHFKEIN